jgi:hypothetical protein
MDLNIDQKHYEEYIQNHDFKKAVQKLESENDRFKNIPSAQKKLALYLLLNNRLDVVKNLDNLLYKRPVPTIEEFLTDEYLPGHPIANPTNIWRKELIEVYNPSSSVFEHILTGAIGCFEGSVRIQLEDGSLISFKEMVESGKQSFNVKSYDEKTNSIVVKEGIEPVLTKYTDDVIELEFEDGYRVQCTLNHRFFTKNRGWVEAQHLEDYDDIVTEAVPIDLIKEK